MGVPAGRLRVSIMVLVSFQKRFIYTKTVKSAGTSVEVFFQPYCLPPDHGDTSRSPGESITDYGIVGRRGPNKPAETIWYNHMPAADVRRYLGDEIWRDYFKFCVVRNPFDKEVSRFFFSLSDEQRDQLRSRDFSEVRRGFQAYVAQGKLGIDRQNYVIDGEICMDFFIRYERLPEGVAEACRRLDIQRGVDEIPRLKAQFRFSDAHFSEFYDKDTEALVARAYAFELDRFGYRLRD